MSRFVRDRLPDPVSYYEAEGLTLTGTGKWRTARCDFHGGSDSLRVNAESGGWVCMAGCGAKGGDVLAYHMLMTGLDFIDAARALGAVDEDATDSAAPKRARSLSAKDALELLYQDSLLVWVAATNLASGTLLTDKDRADLTAAARRILLVSQESL